MLTRIYVLCEPDGEIRYIGKTVKSLQKRLCEHLSTARAGHKNHRCNWLRSVMKTGRLPVIFLLGEASGDGYREERAWIAYGRKEGWRLVNSTDGGEGVSGYKWTEEAKKRFSDYVKQDPRRIAQIKKLALVRKGQTLSKEWCKKVGEASKRMWEKRRQGGAKWISPLKGRKSSEELKKRLSILRTEWWAKRKERKNECK